MAYCSGNGGEGVNGGEPEVKEDSAFSLTTTADKIVSGKSMRNCFFHFLLLSEKLSKLQDLKEQPGR